MRCHRRPLHLPPLPGTAGATPAGMEARMTVAMTTTRRPSSGCCPTSPRRRTSGRHDGGGQGRRHQGSHVATVLRSAAPWSLGAIIRAFSNPSFLFKVGTEVVIDSCCATFAEVRKRGEDFGVEFELYAADLLVRVAVDIALVGLLAPCVRFGKASASTGLFGRFSQMAGALPSSISSAPRG